VAESASLPAALPRRRHLDALTLRLRQEHEEAIARWADWALTQTESWPASDDPGEWDAEAVLAGLAESGSTPPLS
jgi:hypothetical protein